MPIVHWPDSKIYALHTLDDFVEKNNKNIGTRVEFIGQHPVACGGYSDIWKGILHVMSNESCSHEQVILIPHDRQQSTDTLLQVAVKILRHFRGSENRPILCKVRDHPEDLLYIE